MAADCGIFVEIGDERLIDLDLVEGERLEIGQRGVSGAEVVHGDPHAERLEPAQDRNGAGEILHQHAFGDFQLQATRRESGFQQDRVDQGGQVAMAKLHRDRLIATSSWQAQEAASRHASRSTHSPI